MEPVAIFLLLIVLSLTVLYISRPFFGKRRVQTLEKGQEASSLLAERERLLTALEELDFDQTLGKIPQEDYPVQRAELLHKGAEVLRQMDSLNRGSVNQREKNISAMKLQVHAASLSDDDLEDLLVKRRNSRREKTAGFCPRCGKPILQSDIFCPTCGSELN